MLLMRLKLPELMAERKLKNAYALMKASRGDLTITTAVRLVEADGKPKRVDLNTLDTLCRMFDVEDMNDIFVRDDKPVAAAPKRKRRSA
jgi:DNA-binding Xre family transcriptional regulator